MITLAQFKKIAPLAPQPEQMVAALNFHMARCDITGTKRVAMFMAQMAHESGDFTHFSENLNYSAERLMQVWPSRFPNLASTRLYSRNPQALANKVYANRLGNGDEASGDGWKYRGRGIIQLTGRYNYKAASDWVGEDLVAKPELAADPIFAIRIACDFWRVKSLNGLADRENILVVTKIINGGTNGLKERTSNYAKYKIIFADN